MCNSLDPDQAQQFVGSDLGLTVCQGYQHLTAVKVLNIMLDNFCTSFLSDNYPNFTGLDKQNFSV